MRLLPLAIFILFITVIGAQAEKDPVDYANPLIGTSNVIQEFSHGNTYPAVSLPFGMISWTPQTRNRRWIYDYKNKYWQGFRGTHQSNIWMGDYGSFTIMPMVGKLKVNPKIRSSLFSHDKEIATPFYYRTVLETYRIIAEVTPTERCGFFRFTFPRSSDAYILIDTHLGGGKVSISPEKKIVQGFSTYGGPQYLENFRCYFIAEFDKPFSEFGTWDDKKVHPGSRDKESEKLAGGYVKFNTHDNEVIGVKISTSFIGFEQVMLNRKRELGNHGFDSIKTRAREVWNHEFGRIQVDGGGHGQKVNFYSSLYRCLLFPRTLHEIDERGNPRHYSPYNGRICPGVLFGETGFWDTYRAQFPLLILLKPKKVNEIISGLLNAFREGGWIPQWPSPGYRSMMTATHSDAVIADAYCKGIRSFDRELAFQGMRKGATQPGDNRFSGRKGIGDYQKLGYVPVDRVGHATSSTLEFAYDDYCVAQIAKTLGKKAEYQVFMKRSQNYRRIFDPQTGFMRGRNQNGSWITPFNPREWGKGFCEGNAWHYLWSVQHDIRGLIELLGGNQKFIAKLDYFLEMPSEFLKGSYRVVIHEMREMQAIGMGQYAHNNEPVHHVLYLYNSAGQPWKTQRWVRQVMDSIYRPQPAGLIGDDDNGQMSAWYIFSAMGLYPVCPGKSWYAIGSPLFSRISLKLENGRNFVIRAKFNNKNNFFIQEAYLNDKKYSRNWIDHSDLLGGCRLQLVMGLKPNEAWGSRSGDLPPD